MLTSAIVLQPISTKGMTMDDVSGLTERTRNEMLKTLEEFANDPHSRSLSAEMDGNVEKKRS